MLIKDKIFRVVLVCIIYLSFWIKILKYILNNYKIDGIECYYSTFTNTQTKELLSLCQNKSLLVSGGSDYHGLNSPGIDMGSGKGNLVIDESILNNWKEISFFYIEQ